MTTDAEKDAPGIIYIDAPLPRTVLAQAYRMNAEWDRRHRVTASACGHGHLTDEAARECAEWAAATRLTPSASSTSEADHA